MKWKTILIVIAILLVAACGYAFYFRKKKYVITRKITNTYWDDKGLQIETSKIESDTVLGEYQGMSGGFVAFSTPWSPYPETTRYVRREDVQTANEIEGLPKFLWSDETGSDILPSTAKPV